MIIVRFIACGAFFALALASDIKEHKIKNKTVITFLCIGLIINLLTLDGDVIIGALGVMAVPLLLLPLFAVRALGAGDIKALCTAGLIMGKDYGIKVMLYSILGAGVAAFILMIFRKNFKERGKHFLEYLKMSFLMQKFGRYEMIYEKRKFFLFTYGLVIGWTAAVIEYSAVLLGR